MTDTREVFAEEEVTIHKVLEGAASASESVTLYPGDHIPLVEIATYQQEALSAGKIPGLVLVTPAKAKSKEAEAKRRRGEASIDSKLVQHTTSGPADTTEEVVPVDEATDTDDE